MREFIFAAVIAVIFVGCVESVSTYHEREKQNERIRDLEQDATPRDSALARDPIEALTLRLDALEQRIEKRLQALELHR